MEKMLRLLLQSQGCRKNLCFIFIFEGQKVVQCLKCQ
ncbi:hypothetical protein Pint_27152 [Pistacia integerrima]|uniref:Uncharacterized protein n=1 Tax=Pistacia integerrima TaxID=434235 RepID=A0ACC0YQJ6_9ROSI|nr:hypothetical protein Pint_27152 [Pistacia integerrima]